MTEGGSRRVQREGERSIKTQKWEDKDQYKGTEYKRVRNR